MNFSFNRIANCTNPYQGKYKKVLCVCSAGLLRSPTAAFVLSQTPYNYNTRAAGIVEEFALIPVDEVLLHWADEIVCMNENQKNKLDTMLESQNIFRPVFNLDIEDQFEYRDQKLQDAIREAYNRSQEVSC
jgi:predicted protein tyrosine phosphatase